jgi:hypothetical protein
MAVHKGPASLKPKCTRSGSSVAAIPVYQSAGVISIEKGRRILHVER